MPHIFERSGLAALSDLESPGWREVVALLETQQAEFLAKESAFRSPGYKWPRDPLHTWSRVWEYPYVYHHVKVQRSKWRAEALPHVVDVGSGVTFFPFSAARLGYQVTCADIDPVCGTDIPRAARVLSHGPGTVAFRLIEREALPFQNNSIDAVYCISVLEHIRDAEKTVIEIQRILKPGGLFLLTIDLDLQGDSTIGVVAHRKLVEALKLYFDYELPEVTVHPSDILDNTKGPFRTRTRSGLTRDWFLLKQIIKPWFAKPATPLLPFHLAVQGFVLTRKADDPQQW